jgi:hypothetical protein
VATPTPSSRQDSASAPPRPTGTCQGRRAPGGPGPDIAAATQAAAREAYLILDGTLLPIDRIAADRPYYSGKHRKHGMNVQVLADPFGNLLWASPALPGAVHDIRAARTHGIIDALAETGIRCWADKGYQGAGGTVGVSYRGRWEKLSAVQQAVNVLPREDPRVRRTGDGQPQDLATLRKLRCSATLITDLVQAILTLHPSATN